MRSEKEKELFLGAAVLSARAGIVMDIFYLDEL